MRKLTALILFLTLNCFAVIDPTNLVVLKISQYPQTNALNNDSLFITAFTNQAVPTNYNIKYVDLKQGIISGLAGTNQVVNVTNGLANITSLITATNTLYLFTTNLVGASTNGLASTNYVDAAITNRVIVAAGTNVTVQTNYANRTVTYTVNSSGGTGDSTNGLYLFTTNLVATATNGLAPTTYVNTATNTLYGFSTNLIATTATNSVWIIAGTNITVQTNFSGDKVSFTVNGAVATNLTGPYILDTNGFGTNTSFYGQVTNHGDVVWFTNGGGSIGRVGGVNAPKIYGTFIEVETGTALSSQATVRAVGETDTGLWWPAANDLGIMSQGSGVVRFRKGTPYSVISPEVDDTLNIGATNNAIHDIYIKGLVHTVNGVSSYATNATMTVASTGCTNATGVTQIAYITGGTSVMLFDNRGTAEWSGVQTVAGLTPFRIQPGGSITGTSITNIGTHAW